MTSQSVRGVLDAQAAKTPDAPFLMDPGGGAAMTYGATREAAAAFAARLGAHGIAPGEPVAYAMANGADTARVILGCLYGGFVATAVNLVSGTQTIAYVLAHSGARVVFVQPGTRALVEEALAGAASGPEIIEANEDWFTPVAASQQTALDGTADGLLMYTSGTTGRPKGVTLTHDALIAGGTNTTMAHALSARDRALCVLPLYHINGLCVTLLAPLVSGGGVVLPPRFSVAAFWALMRDHACTWFSVVPTQISYLLHDETEHRPAGLEQVRFGRSASSALAPEVQRGFEQRFGVPLVETMGLTETAAQILSNPLPPAPRKIGSPGMPVGNEVIIGDDAQREKPRGEEGEILVRGANVMRCYRDNPDATAQALTPAGWLRTGDLGRMDEDGYVFVTGRLKELIIKGGENIAPREIDEVLYTHPDVIEAAAFPRPCTRYGQEVEAAVALREGSGADEAALIGLCRAAVGRFKAPVKVHILPELPKGPSGKIQRLKLAGVTEGGT